MFLDLQICAIQILLQSDFIKPSLSISRWRDTPKFFINSNVIGNTKEIKLLGVTLDKDLHFSKQIADNYVRLTNKFKLM